MENAAAVPLLAGFKPNSPMPMPDPCERLLLLLVIDSTSGAGAILLLVLLVLYPLVGGIPVLGQIICAGRRWLIVYSRQRSRHLFCVCDFVFAFSFQIYFLCMFCVELYEGNNWRAPACFQFKLTYRWHTDVFFTLKLLAHFSCNEFSQQSSWLLSTSCELLVLFLSCWCPILQSDCSILFAIR